MKKRLFCIHLLSLVYLLGIPNVSIAERHYAPNFPEGLPYSKYIEKINDPSIKHYLALWKQAFLDINDSSEEYFDRSILFKSASFDEGVNSVPDSVFLTLIYKVEWFEQEIFTHFAVKFPSSYTNKSFNKQGIKYGNALSDEDVIKLLHIADVFDGNRIKVPVITEPFKYKTRDEAINKLKELLGETKEKKVVFFREGAGMDAKKYPKELFIYGNILLPGSEKYCKRAVLGLVTGYSVVNDEVCGIVKYD